MIRIAFFFKQLCLLLLFSLPLGILLVGCAFDEALRIGFLGSTTGRMADFGISARDAVQLAVDQCNEAGGIHGRRVELLIRDDQQDVDTAEQAVVELIEADVAAIVGPTSSNMALAVTPFLNESHVVAVGSTVTTQDLSGLDDYFFRVCFTAREHAYRSAHYQIRSGNMRRIAVAYDAGNRAFCENWMENFTIPFIAGGGEILTAIEFTASDRRSFSEIAHELMAVDPDGIMILANPMDSAILCQQVRKSNPSINITLSHWSATQRLIELGGKAVEGVTLPIAFDWDSPSPIYQTFRKAFVERYRRDPEVPGGYAYDAAQVVLTALKSRKRGESVKATLLSIGEFEGLQGKIRFDAYGDVASSTVAIRIVRNQKFVAVE